MSSLNCDKSLARRSPFLYTLSKPLYSASMPSRASPGGWEGSGSGLALMPQKRAVHQVLSSFIHQDLGLFSIQTVAVESQDSRFLSHVQLPAAVGLIPLPSTK